MGFKTAGFPSFGFNPIGFRTSGNLLKQLIKCGLKVYNTPKDDKLNNGDREPQLSQTILGDGNTYLDTGITPNATTDIKSLKGNWTTTNGNFEIPIGARVGTERFLIARDNSGAITFGYGTSQQPSIKIADMLEHEYSTKGAKLYYDGDLIVDLTGQTISAINIDLFIQALNFSTPVNIANFNITHLEIDHNGETYTLDTTSRDTDGVWLLKKSSGGNIPAQQYLSPAIPTEDNLLVESDYDKYGGSVSRALGKNLFSFPQQGFIEGGSNAYRTIIAGTVSYIAKVDPNTQYTISKFDLSNRNIIGLFNTLPVDGVIATSVSTVEQTLTTEFDTEYIAYYVSNDSQEPRVQLELGAVATAYEPYNGYTYDALGTLPVPQGTLMSANAQRKLSTYANGVLATPDSTGAVKVNNRIVDGVADNGVDYENYVTDFGTYQSLDYSNDGIKAVFIAERCNFNLNTIYTALKPETQYTIILTSTVNTIGEKIRFGASAFPNNGDSLLDPGFVGEQRTLATTVSGSLDGLTASFNVNSSTTGTINYKVSVYEGDYVTGNPPLPTTGVFETGNSIIREHLYFDASYEPSFFYTLGVPNVIPYDDLPNIVSNQIYASLDKQKISTFEAPLTGECDHKARRFVDINEQYMVQTSEGSGVYEPYVLDGNPLWVIKQGVVIDV